jgi:hypothetical protein
MNNESLKAIIAELGSKIFLIQMDDGHKVWIGTPNSDGNTNTIEDIQFKTFGNVDMFGVRHVDHSWGNEIPYWHWMVTSYVQFVVATEELSDHLPDVNRFF